MNEVMDYLFSPLGKEWCMYFYFLSVLAYVSFVVAVVFVIFSLVKKGRTMTFLTGFTVIFHPFLLYFVNRMFYSICVNSLA